MDKNMVGLIGAVTALVAAGSAQAAPVPPLAEVMRAGSYADLLKPIPNALALLRASPVPTDDGPAPVEDVQFRHHHHHHHHHHHRYVRRRVEHHHHHHHHHHHRFIVGF